MPKEFEEIKTPDMDSFAAFDIETSGSEGAARGGIPSDITEIGAVKVINGQIIETFSELCNPEAILPRIERLTGITDEMVADKPSVNEVIRQFKDFCGDLPLVGHNIRSMDLRTIFLPQPRGTASSFLISISTLTSMPRSLRKAGLGQCQTGISGWTIWC